MINPKELRIDNLFHPGMVIEDGSLIPDSGIIHRVGSIDKFGNIQVIDPGQPAVSLKHGKIFPIALTSEWLEGCGFVRRPPDEDYEYWGIKNFTLLYGRIEGGGYGFFLNGYHNDCRIETFHHLQNVFHALTGTELEIKHP